MFPRLHTVIRESSRTQPNIGSIHRRWISIPPDKDSLTKVFGSGNSATFLAAAADAASIPHLHGLPEVIVTGRANTGKSTLLNAVLGRKDLLHTSKKAGRTRALNFFRVGAEPGQLVVVDAPGYGSRGRQSWGDMFSAYISTRKALRRVYILFNGKHEMNEVDIAMLGSLHEQCLTTNAAGNYFTLQAIITKADAIPSGDVTKVITQMRQQIFKAAPTCLPPLITSAYMSPPFGIEQVRMNILDACDLIKTKKKK